MNSEELAIHKMLYNKSVKFGFRIMPSFATKNTIKTNQITVVDISSIRASKKKKKVAKCLKCHKIISKSFKDVKIGNDICMSIQGYYCQTCKRFYAGYNTACKAKEITDINPFDEHIQYFFKEPNTGDKDKEPVSNDEILIKIRYFSGNEECFRIVSDEAKKNDSMNSYHYSSNVGLELLSAAFAKQRNSKGSFNDKKFYVIKIIQPQKFERNYFCMKNQINIKQGGGYISGALRGGQRLIDILLYSPYKEKYQIAKATYDKFEDEIFIDGRKYRRFVIENGNPELQYRLYNSERESFYDISFFDGLQAESVLKVFGYNVAKDSELSESKRQQLLADLIDMNIISDEKVANYLQFFIDMHRGESYYYAREKWKRDLQFVENYNKNPKRFLILRS